MLPRRVRSLWAVWGYDLVVLLLVPLGVVMLARMVWASQHQPFSWDDPVPARRSAP
jgi:hypothetical protein